MVDEGIIKDVLKESFGFENFRSLQKQVVDAVLGGRDNLVIMPTGGGKSICYQLPALLLPGVTLVISPLIALMKDQVDGLRANGISAAYLNSSQGEQEQQETLSRLSRKEIKLLYLAPESLSFIDTALNPGDVSLIAIDEAHCISSWGHDFRPSYTQLGYLKHRFTGVPVIALTATADKATREDICQQLNIPEAERHIASFDRKNLSLEVRPGTKRLEQIIAFLGARKEESGIIYCLSRKATEELAAKLSAKGHRAEAYHAGLAFESRARIQEDFVNDRNHIICATIAFGMGIDKSNVRWVIHYNLPKNLEGYYQEIGRAGRDGLPASTLLFHSYSDVVQLRKFSENSGNSEVQLAKLERMKQYSEALSCRRKILLSYFGELVPEDCGNCDVCQHPPKFFNGTILAQKALSTIYRLKGQEPISMVIDVLRGANNSQVHGKGYQHVKTFGIAGDVSWRDWQQYLIQLMNLGYVEIAFHDQNKLQLTSLAKRVLFENEQVDLAVVTVRQSDPQATVAADRTADSLFERLRKLRLKIATQEEIPAYLIFNDATLKEMEKIRPMTDEEFLQVNGVGRQKMQDYGYRFIKEIIAFSKEKRASKSQKQKNTFKVTLALLNQGKTLEEICQERSLTQSTIYSHLIRLHEDGEDVDLHQFLSPSDLESVRKVKEALGAPESLKPYFEHLEGSLDYGTLRLALYLIQQED